MLKVVVLGGHFPPEFPAQHGNMSSDGGKKKSRGSAAVAPSSRINHVASSKSSEIAGTLPWTADDDRTILEAAEKELRKPGYIYIYPCLWFVCQVEELICSGDTNAENADGNISCSCTIAMRCLAS